MNTQVKGVETTFNEIVPPVGEIPRDGSCASLAFYGDPTLQQAFDGDTTNETAIDAAKALCAACTQMEACADYAKLNPREDVLLAGHTAEERRANHNRSTITNYRRHLVDVMLPTGITIIALSEATQFPLRTLEKDIADLSRR